MKELRGLLLMGILLGALPVLGQAEMGSTSKIAVRSTAFSEGENIPKDFTCDAADRSPSIEWSGVPANARSLAIILEDPDAPVGVWTHWVVYDLPPTLTQLPAGISALEKLSVGGFQGQTDFGRVGYGGPCPPKGPMHRYFFKVYALDVMLHLKPSVSKKELLYAMQGHVLAEGQLMGKYQRS